MTQNVINDGQARRIAADWHGGQASALYSLASSGYVRYDDLRSEIESEVVRLDVGEVRRDLLALRKYVMSRAGWSAVEGWSKLWDDTPVTVEQC